MSSRFLCVTPVIVRFYLDLPRAAKNRVCTLEVGCRGVPTLRVRGICNRRLIKVEILRPYNFMTL